MGSPYPKGFVDVFGATSDSSRLEGLTKIGFDISNPAISRSTPLIWSLGPEDYTWEALQTNELITDRKASLLFSCG